MRVRAGIVLYQLHPKHSQRQKKSRYPGPQAESGLCSLLTHNAKTRRSRVMLSGEKSHRAQPRTKQMTQASPSIPVCIFDRMWGAGMRHFPSNATLTSPSSPNCSPWHGQFERILTTMLYYGARNNMPPSAIWILEPVFFVHIKQHVPTPSGPSCMSKLEGL